MTQNKKRQALQRLTLPAAAVQRLRKAGIFCSPGITIEFQRQGSGTSCEAVNRAERLRNSAIT
jgi:hypothetical protein